MLLSWYNARQTPGRAALWLNFAARSGHPLALEPLLRFGRFLLSWLHVCLALGPGRFEPDYLTV